MNDFAHEFDELGSELQNHTQLMVNQTVLPKLLDAQVQRLTTTLTQLRVPGELTPAVAIDFVLSYQRLQAQLQVYSSIHHTLTKQEYKHDH